MHNKFISDHHRIDQRSLAMHKIIVNKIQSTPELLNVAKANLQRWLSDSPDKECFLEWKEILKCPLETILLTIVKDNENMKRLRQSTPFCGILSNKERWNIYESFAARTYYQGIRDN